MNRITTEPGKRGGQPTIRGLRITVYDVLRLLADGTSEADILGDFPELEAADIRACLAYAADRERNTATFLARCCFSSTKISRGGWLEFLWKNHESIAETARLEFSEPYDSLLTTTWREQIMTVIVNGDQSQTVTPTANPASTYTSFSCQGTADNGTDLEYLGIFGFTSNVGYVSGGNTNNKVALYSGIVGDTNTGNIWALNTVTELASTSSNSYTAYGYELDFNNYYADRGNGAGGSGLTSPVAVGLAISGGAQMSPPTTYLSTAAISIESATGSGIWNRGIVVGSSSVNQQVFKTLAHRLFLSIYGVRTLIQ
jgi:uncharacterized protein (DUF433 family)